MEDNNVQSNIINVKSHSDEKIHEIMEFAGIGRNETIKVLDFMCDEKNEIFKAIFSEALQVKHSTNPGTKNNRNIKLFAASISLRFSI